MEIGQNTTIMKKDKFGTPVRLVAENSSECQKSEEWFEVDRSSLRACTYLHKKHKLQKKSEKLQRQAQKLMLKVANMKLMKESELKIDDWIDIMFQLWKQRDILKIKLNGLFRKSNEIEKEGKEMHKHLSELQRCRDTLFLSREKLNQVLIQAQNSLEVLLDDTCFQRRFWSDLETSIEYHFLLRLISNLKLRKTEMNMKLKEFKNGIDGIAQNHITRCRRKVEIEKLKLFTLRKIADTLKKIFNLEGRVGLFQIRKKVLRDRAANLDFLAEAFLKQQSALHSKVSNLNDYQGVQQDAFPGQIKQFSWKVQSLTKHTGQLYKRAVYLQRHFLDVVEIPVEPWMVSSKEVLRQEHCKFPQRDWNVESYSEATEAQKIVNYGQQEKWRVSGNTVHLDGSPHTKELVTTDVNSISVEHLKI
ncbi:uncharacterized protein [Panulirus ornatus]|uniref:uncharacterized protein n=1 Tax=Panulirus ornatus TaxID=150431 RepID=UPI003A835092